MADLYNSVCLTTVKNTVLSAMGLKTDENAAAPNSIVTALLKDRLGEKSADRVLLYNPDAVALWLYGKYTEMFTDALLLSDMALPMLSVMPSVTPVCFASMYTGVMPDVHGIKKYEKPVLKTDTLFDALIRECKKACIISTEGDSISKIFLERDMDYFLYETPDEVNKKALEVLAEDKYDVIAIYNGNYDGFMHKFGPESGEALSQLTMNISFYSELVKSMRVHWKNHNVLYGFLPDHGCHEIDGGCGSHGLDMEDDMNIIHFYGVKKAE